MNFVAEQNAKKKLEKPGTSGEQKKTIIRRSQQIGSQPPPEVQPKPIVVRDPKGYYGPWPVLFKAKVRAKSLESVHYSTFFE